MKVWTAAAAALALTACSQPAPDAPAPAAPVTVNAPAGEYALDNNHSTVTVRARHFGLAYYTLRFNAVSGTLNFNAETPTQSTVSVTVDTTSLDTPFTGERDFDAELQNTARVTGDLTLHGVTRPVTLDVTYNGSWAQHPMGPPIAGIGFSARGTIQRSQFGLTTLIPASGPDSGVADEVELLIEAEFNRPTEGATPAPTPAEPVN
jgi:polyisoprenoid-binding protein YceI